MELIGKTSKIANSLITWIINIIMCIVIVLAIYSLYTSYMLFNGAYISDKLLSIKPVAASNGSSDRYNFDELININSDVKAWITVDNTRIDYPVLKGKTNLEYVNKDIYGEFAFEGCIFSDVRNNETYEDPYNLLYGHHMDNGGMFGDLQLFLERDFFENNNTGKLITKLNYYKIEFFSVVQTNGYDQRIFNPLTVKTKENIDGLLQYLETIKIHSRKANFMDGDKLIALSTCTSTDTNGRTILFGVMKKN